MEIDRAVATKSRYPTLPLVCIDGRLGCTLNPKPITRQEWHDKYTKSTLRQGTYWPKCTIFETTEEERMFCDAAADNIPSRYRAAIGVDISFKVCFGYSGRGFDGDRLDSAYGMVKEQLEGFISAFRDALFGCRDESAPMEMESVAKHDPAKDAVIVDRTEGRTVQGIARRSPDGTVRRVWSEGNKWHATVEHVFPSVEALREAFGADETLMGALSAHIGAESRGRAASTSGQAQTPVMDRFRLLEIDR